MSSFKVKVIPTGRVSDKFVCDERLFLNDNGAFTLRKHAAVFTADSWQELQAHMRSEGKYDDRIAGVELVPA